MLFGYTLDYANDDMYVYASVSMLNRMMCENESRGKTSGVFIYSPTIRLPSSESNQLL